MTESLETSWRHQRTRDPRADDWPEDSTHWVWLFKQVFDAGNLDLLGGLNYIRCFGARIVRSASGTSWRIGRGDCSGEVYELVKSEVLTRNWTVMSNFFRAIPDRDGSVTPLR